jgi:hypothetical protein
VNPMGLVFRLGLAIEEANIFPNKDKYREIRYKTPTP